MDLDDTCRSRFMARSLPVLYLVTLFAGYSRRTTIAQVDREQYEKQRYVQSEGEPVG